MFHVKQFDLVFVYEILFATANRICRGAAPADPAKGVPPFGTLLRGLRARYSAVIVQNSLSGSSSRDSSSC